MELKNCVFLVNIYSILGRKFIFWKVNGDKLIYKILFGVKLWVKFRIMKVESFNFIVYLVKWEFIVFLFVIKFL